MCSSCLSRYCFVCSMFGYWFLPLSLDLEQYSISHWGHITTDGMMEPMLCPLCVLLSLVWHSIHSIQAWRKKIADNMTFSNGSCWMRNFIFCSRFNWSVFLEIQLTKSQHLFREIYLHQCYLRHLYMTACHMYTAEFLINEDYMTANYMFITDLWVNA